MRKLIFQLQMYAVAVFFCGFPAFSLKAGNFEIPHVRSFNQAALMHGHVINYAGISSPQIEHVPSVLKVKSEKPVPSISGWRDETDADVAWRNYYRKTRTQGIARTTSGAVLLAGGLGAVVAGTLIFNHANLVLDNAISTYGGWTDTVYMINNQLTSKYVIGESLMGLGSAMVCAGIPLLCSGSHFLSKARGIKRDAEHHDVIVYWAPAINPEIRNYACAFSLKF